MSRTRLERLTINQGGLAGEQTGAIWIRADAEGGFELADAHLEGVANESRKFQVSEAK